MPTLHPPTTTYTIIQSASATRSFTQSLQSRLCNSHRSISANYSSNLKIITIIPNAIHHPTESGDAKMSTARYIRIVIDVPTGVLEGGRRKRELLEGALRCCVEYEGKHAEETEMEVRINEIGEDDWVGSAGRRGR